ncbi:MAG: UDP-2,3-diacylglucosamine diphosphatase LpxI [Hyphomonadaceae bacterium]|nr:UDP-2,3-diacylglucosamine diphosphatase LpxI [Hyphomonadaceae bacterium]
MAAWRKLGIIAAGGDLPLALAEQCQASGQPYFVARVTPFADVALAAHPNDAHDLGAMGARIEALKQAGCDAITFVGQASRQDLTKLNWDAVGISMLPALAAGAREGDDALLRALLNEHAKHGFQIVGADEVTAEMVAPAGVLGGHAPSAADMNDIQHAARVVAALGALDIGQAAVVCAGLTLGVEAQEGTDALLRRIADLPAIVRGSPDSRRGVLLKRPKPIQERRVDLPVIGVRTMEGAAKAGLSGVAVEAGAALLVRRDAIIAAADAAGVFVYGFTRADIGEA